MSTNQPRSSDGRFGPIGRGEATIGLGGAGPGATQRDAEEEACEVAATTTDSRLLSAAIDAEDVAVRCAALDNPHLTDSQIDALTDPARQPLLVRLSAGALPYPRATIAALRDPNPLVRAVAGADPSTDSRARAVVAALAAW